jgi:hypothetical protein
MENSSLSVASARFASWLVENRSSFGVRHVHHPMRQLTLLKPLAEYALCNELLLSYGASSKDHVENLAWAWDEIENGGLITRLLLARSDAFSLASLYGPFRRFGFRNERLESVLHEISMLRGTQVAEMQAWTRLGFLHVIAQVDQVSYDPHAAGATWLLGLPEPWCINDDIVYSVTHEVFYASDFGCSLFSLPENVIRYLNLWIPAWARGYIESKNWDITAELCIVADSLPDFEWDNDPLPLILANQTDAGSVPGPVGAGGLLMDGSETEEQKRFYATYHSTLVSALAVGVRQKK